MTRIQVRKLIWEQWIIVHIKKHSVSVHEVEEAIKAIVLHKQGHDGRYIAIGRSGTRILSVIIKREKQGEYRIITDRDSDKKERRLVYVKESNKNSNI